MYPAGSGAEGAAPNPEDSPKPEVSNETPDATEDTPEPVEPTVEEQRRTVMATGISEKDREYKTVPARDKPDPSTVMRTEVLPGD
jgi:hypothetical protein